MFYLNYDIILIKFFYSFKKLVLSSWEHFTNTSRTHRVDLDWLFERISNDPGISIKCVPTKEQIADSITKGSFTADAWNLLCKLCVILPSSMCKVIPDKPTKQWATAAP